MHDPVIGVPVAVQVRVVLVRLIGIPGHQILPYYGRAKYIVHPQVGGDARGGIKYMDDVVPSVSITVQVAAPLGAFKDDEGEQIPLRLPPTAKRC